jgi:hypothetical protein
LGTDAETHYLDLSKACVVQIRSDEAAVWFSDSPGESADYYESVEDIAAIRRAMEALVEVQS